MLDEEHDGLLNVVKLVHNICIDIIKLICSNLEPARKLWLP